MTQDNSTTRLSWLFAVAVALSAALLGCDRTERSIVDMRSNEPKRQLPAAGWLQDHPTPAALGVLRFGMESKRLDVRVASAAAIGATGDASAMAYASRVLRADALDEDPKIAEAALEGMRGVGGAALPDLITVAMLTTDRYVQIVVRASIAEVLVSATDGERLAGASALIDGVAETDPDLYRAAYALLVMFAQIAPMELVDVGLGHHGRRIQLTTMMGMTDAVCIDAAPAIETFLRHADSVLRLEAVRSLRVLGNISMLPELEEMAAHDPVLDVQKAAREAVAAIRAMPTVVAEEVAAEEEE